jgi:predicted unusual protein kinase regulating ubiquinone biosynthesis (AarF/ABC1/UbiB family)
MHRGGIVHVAELHGEKLAVKVQFPGLRETCQGDTWTIGVLVKAVGWV